MKSARERAREFLMLLEEAATVEDDNVSGVLRPTTGVGVQ